MDSLLASYASSDDEEETGNQASAPPTKPPSLSLPPPKPISSSLPPPKPISSSLPQPRLFSALPPPKSHAPTTDDDEIDGPKSRKPSTPSPISSHLPPPKSSSLFSSLPTPKSTDPAPIAPAPKRVVQIKPLIPPPIRKPSNSDDDDDDDDAKERKPSKNDSSSSFSMALSSMLPAPKNSLCLAPSSAFGAARKSILQDVPAASTPESSMPAQETAEIAHATAHENYASYEAGAVYRDYSGGGEASGWVPSYGAGEDYGNYGSSEAIWSGVGGSAAMPDIPDTGRILGKRGRKEVPIEIVEVKQDELMKDRPRLDQVKMTGIAFGPAYQPASSGKGAKPSKLLKRKHQIGALYFDMRSKEMELAERRSRGLLTKAETQAKYGW